MSFRSVLELDFSQEKKKSLMNSQRTKLRNWRIAIFFITYCSYGCYHIARKALSNVRFLSKAYSPVDTTVCIMDLFSRFFLQQNRSHIIFRIGKIYFADRVGFKYCISWQFGYYISLCIRRMFVCCR